MDEEELVREELERLALAQLAADATDDSATATNPEPATQLAHNLGISATLASDLLKTQASTAKGSAGNGQELTALVTVPAGFPEELMFRLEAPIDTPTKLEDALQLSPGTLQVVAADRTGDYGERIEETQFVFVTNDLKSRILAWIHDNNARITPLFVKLTETW